MFDCPPYALFVQLVFATNTKTKKSEYVKPNRIAPPTGPFATIRMLIDGASPDPLAV